MRAQGGRKGGREEGRREERRWDYKMLPCPAKCGGLKFQSSMLPVLLTVEATNKELMEFAILSIGM